MPSDGQEALTTKFLEGGPWMELAPILAMRIGVFCLQANFTNSFGGHFPDRGQDWSRSGKLFPEPISLGYRKKHSEATSRMTSRMTDDG